MWAKYLFIFLFSIGLAVLASFFNALFTNYFIFWDYLSTYLLYYWAGILILYTQKPISKTGYVICVLMPIYLIIAYVFIDSSFDTDYRVLYAIKLGIISLGGIMPIWINDQRKITKQQWITNAVKFVLVIPCLYLIQLYIVAPLEYNQLNVPLNSTLEVELEQANVIDKDSVALQLPRNKVIVLNFTFHSCAPCRMKAKPFQQLANKFSKNPQVEFYTIHGVEGYQFFKENYADIPNAYHDQTGVFAKVLNVQSFPTELILNKKGEICNVMNGFELEMQGIYLEERQTLIQKLIHEK